MFTSRLQVEDLARPDIWCVVLPLTWTDGADTIIVPTGFVTDLASIPWIIRGPLLDVNGRSRRPAVLHDWLYNQQERPRAECDTILAEALKAEGERSLVIDLYYYGVRLFGWIPWDRRVKRGGGTFPDDFIDAVTFDKYKASFPGPPKLPVT